MLALCWPLSSMELYCLFSLRKMTVCGKGWLMLSLVESLKNRVAEVPMVTTFS